jgi:YD repeat-containing protein
MRNSNTKSSLLIVVSLVLCLLQTAFATQYQYDNLNRLSQATLDDGTKIVYSYDASGNRSQKVITFQADLDLDIEVDFKDFAILATQWLDVPGNPSADMAPWPNVDNFIDYEDLAKLAEQWLAGSP